MTEPEVIVRLRAVAAAEPTVPNITQIRHLRDELRLADTTLDRAARLVGLPAEQVVETVTSMGKWLLQSNKLQLPELVPAAEYYRLLEQWECRRRGSGRRARSVSQTGVAATQDGQSDIGKQLSMFASMASTPKKLRASGHGPRARAFDTYRAHDAGQLSMLNMPAKPASVRQGQKYIAPAPEGFLEVGNRAMVKPLAALLAHEISDEQIDRWVARTYTASLPMLTFPVVAAVWRMATLGVLDKLDEVSDSPKFAKVAIEAWELLEYSRMDALEAVAELTGELLVVSKLPLEDGPRSQLAARVLHRSKQARWLCEQDLSRVAKAAAATATDPRTQPSLCKGLQYLRQRAATQPQVYQLNGIDQVREGQLLRVAQLAGLPTERPDAHSTSEIRKRIKQLQLGRDVDQLVPNAVVADQAGRLDRYMSILEARSTGDVTWLSQMLSLASEPHELRR